MFLSRPFVAITALLIGGIVVARYLRPELHHLLVAMAVMAPFCFWKKSRSVAFALGILLLGASLYVERYRLTGPNDLRVVLSGEPELITVRGKLLESPEVREFQSGKSEVSYSYATLEVLEVQKPKQGWRPAHGRIATRLRGVLTPDFFQGRTVEISGVIAFPASAAAPGLFDYRTYLHHTRIFHQLKSDSTNDWRLVSFEKMPITEHFRRWATAQLRRGIPERDEASDIIAAMTLGLRNSMNGEMADVFMRTGTLHIVAISGLHVACIAYFFSRAVRICGVARSIEALIIIAIVWFYTVATGLQSSAARSALMATIFMLVWIFRRPTELLNTVAASATIILLLQPEQLFQASFQLSFSVVLVIALAAALIERNYRDALPQLTSRILRIDPLLPYELVPRWKKIAKRAFRMFAANLMVSVASWVGSMPLTAYYFNTVTPVSLVANLVAVPLSSISLGATVVSLVIPPIAPVSNYIAWIFMDWTITAVKFFGGFSFGYFYVPKPNTLFLLAYGTLVAVLLVPRFRSGVRKFSSAVLVGALSMLWLGSVYLGKPLTTLTVLPCAGTPMFVEGARGKDLLIDCTSDRDADYMLKRFLRAKGRGSLDGLVITHGDAQVVGGFPLLWNEFAPGTVFTTSARMRSPGYRRAIDTLTNNSDRWKTVAAGDDLNGWTVLHPPRNARAFPRADDNAIVLRTQIGAWTVLHLSDLGQAGQQQLLENGVAHADVVIAGMPEQGEPLSKELLDAIRPQVVILGTAEYPYTALGTPDLRKRLEESGATIFYIDEEDAVTITVSAAECLITSMRGQRISLPIKAKGAE